jgi:tRNA-Thr(GGU) m(6)t(6)A37 methyltransferase TsaA
MTEFSHVAIGYLRTPFTDAADMPIQPAGAKGIAGVAEVLPDYVDGLRDLDGFSHLILLYEFHRARRSELLVTPFLSSGKKGVFSTRAPTRPNPIGLSVVELVKVEGGKVHIRNVDMLDGTPLLDIKPYVPDFDAAEDVRTGWMEDARGRAVSARSDARFSR